MAFHEAIINFATSIKFFSLFKNNKKKQKKKTQDDLPELHSSYLYYQHSSETVVFCPKGCTFAPKDEQLMHIKT